jgi:hypothetical protein
MLVVFTGWWTYLMMLLMYHTRQIPAPATCAGKPNPCHTIAKTVIEDPPAMDTRMCKRE